MKDYTEDNEVYMLSVMVMTSVLSSHPTLIGAPRRLFNSDICELLVTTMRSQCAVHQCSQSRAWMHFSFPYTCRVCVVHCTAVYCCLTCEPSFSVAALGRLREAQFHGMLQCPPAYLCDTLTLESAVAPDGILAAPAEASIDGTHRLSPSGSLRVITRKDKASNSLVLFDSHVDEEDEEDEDKEEFNRKKIILSEEAQIKQRILTAGVFHIPSEAKNSSVSGIAIEGGISSATLERENYAGSKRNVEFVAYMTRKEKDHIMSTLFRFFDVE